MAAILIHERKQIKEIEAESAEIRQVRRDINVAHYRIMELATFGESLIGWEKADNIRYHALRLRTDSLLQILKPHCTAYVCPAQIDTLCTLLAEKEDHLLHIMEVMEQQVAADSLLVNHLPEVVRRATCIHTVEQKKSGLAGLFGGKKSVQVLSSAKELHQFSDSLITLQQRQAVEMDIYADSLCMRNKILNGMLNRLVSDLDRQTLSAFAWREHQMDKAKESSFLMFVIVIVVSVGLLLCSFLIICSDLHNEEKIKLKLKQVNRENEELLEMRKKIILTVSHDIRGPLGNINNCADLVSDTQEKEIRETYLADIRHSCYHILHLVNNLMDAYRINEAGDLKNDTPFCIDRFLQRISDEFSRKANVKGLIFYSVHENMAQTVKGDADKLEQIFANLLTNAIKFTSSGSVRFHTEYAEGKLWVEICDTGIGMDEETQKRIFEPFERAAQNVNSEGFGLGLYLTKGLVKVLDGNLNMESVPGKGSLFRLEFPLPETEESEREELQEYGQIITLPKRVLVVDDDLILLKIAEDMLGRKGIICTTCVNVKEVMAALGQADYDMVLTDIQMPDTDGFGLLKLLRNSSIGNSKKVPVAVMTARGDSNIGVYEKEGFIGCIHKPFNIRSLLAFLSSVVSKQKQFCDSKFDFTYLLESTDDGKYILSLVAEESKKELKELKQALETVDSESIRKTVHRMMSVWEILRKDCLLRDLQTILHDKESSDDTICEHTREVMKWLALLIEETEKELKKYEDTDC